MYILLLLLLLELSGPELPADLGPKKDDDEEGPLLEAEPIGIGARSTEAEFSGNVDDGPETDEDTPAACGPL